MACYPYGFCSSVSFTRTPKTFNSPIVFQSQQLRITQISVQESVSEVTHDNNKKNYIWVNPKSPKASNFRKKSYDSRYTILTQVAESLNSCSPVEKDVCHVLDTSLSGKLVEQDGVIILNNLSNTRTARMVLKYFQDRCKLSREVVLYNVTLKVFRKSKDLSGAEKLFDEMLQRGVKPDNVTFSTIIGCSRLKSLPGKAVEWFEKMSGFGIQPDDVTYSVMIDCYGRVGNVDMALRLYDRSRTEKWRLDAVTFTTIIKIYGTSGNFDGCLTVFEEMKALGVKPNLVCYNTLLDAMGRAKRPWQVKSIYQQILSNGLTPGWATYAALIRAYGKARYCDDAMNVYKEMKAKGMNLSNVLYNILLSMCADVGFVDEAVGIYEDMKTCSDCQPDSWTYSALITIFSCCGKVSEAEATVQEMTEAGFEPNIYVLTSLIQCYGKSNRTDDVLKTFDRIIELGITPDERTCGCLLNVMTQTPNEELGKLATCIEKANSRLGRVVKLLIESDIENGSFKNDASEVLVNAGSDVRKAYCNCLIDLCINLDQLEKACDLLELGINLGIYSDLQTKSASNWYLHLKSLSLGAGLTALHIWINDLTKCLEEGDELPPLLGINTGHGKHKYSDKGLAGGVESHLKELNAPFYEAPEKAGWFLTTKVAAKSWLEARCADVTVAA
ncbi:pentatricopeptide repeat-containing protein At4g16390, chloroplastic-like [Rutidosis leptorrhynchoides]|uniref:pentatricopeptide repeat-containing protein At4g16390, chloroplastic-like n=1 Tax=Rutidosis leptorrhynchoides TaxID=125765 RepID=UPI003A99DEE8